MKEIMIELHNLRKKTNGDINIIKSIEDEKALFPFSVENRLLAYYLALGEITYERYSQLNAEYCERNKYLDLFDMAPRTYGQTWGEEHVRTLFPQFVKATKENVSAEYPAFDGEFDLWLDGIRNSFMRIMSMSLM